MREILLKKFNIENPDENSEILVENEDWNEVLFNGPKEKLRRRKNRIRLDGKYTKTEEKLLSRYRNGGDGFIEWCEDNVCLAIYHEGASVPKWTPMRQLPEDKHPDTGRSYKDMWEKQKPILREALEMKNGRFIYTLVVFCWPRGDGKSLIACLIQLWKFFCFARQQIMLGANSKDQVKFVHYDIMKDIILNSPNLVKILGKKNIQEKEIRLLDSKKRVMSIIRSISSFSGIVSNITGYTFSEIFDMKNPRFFVQLDGSIRNMPNALGVIDSTVSEKTHILYALYQSYLKREENGDNLTYFSYRCSPEGDASDFFNPQMTQKQLNSYKNKFPPAEFARYFRNLWDTGITKLFTPAMLEAMHYVSFVGKEYVVGSTALQDHLDKKDKLKQLLEVPKSERKYELDETKVLRDVAKMYAELVPIKSIYALDDSPYFCSMATSVDLESFTEFYDTHWCIGIGVDRADPMKEKMDGARTILTIVAKGLPGSRSNPRLTLATDLVNKYIYIILGVMHVADSSLETIKELTNSAEEEFEYIDTFCSERWGMFDIAPWLQDKGIEPEILHPSPSKQMEAFSEVYIVVRNERLKTSPISYNGSKGPDILMEEMSMFETAPEKVWYGSPEKNQTNGVQDDVVFSLGWCVYGLRFKTVDDMRPRSGKLMLGNYIANKELVGSYEE